MAQNTINNPLRFLISCICKSVLQENQQSLFHFIDKFPDKTLMGPECWIHHFRQHLSVVY